MDEVNAAAERQRWADSASSWDRWAERMADPAIRINVPMLDLARITPDSMVLDVAAGVGEPSLTVAANLVDGHLVSCDLIPAMLTHLRRRAAKRNLTLGLAAADMTALPFTAAQFDVAFCRFGLMFVPDPRAALAELRRVLRPGGRAVLAVWGARADNSLFDQLDHLLNIHLGPDPEQMLSNLFRFADPVPILNRARDSGFSATRLETLRLKHKVDADQAFWRPTLEMGFAQRLASLPLPAADALHKAIMEYFNSKADRDGRVGVDMSIHLLLLQA